MRRIIAERLLLSKQTIPHFYLRLEVDAAPLIELRKQVNAQAEKIITATEDRLIRSAGSSARRRSHYAAIAQAAGSTKRILRS